MEIDYYDKQEIRNCKLMACWWFAFKIIIAIGLLFLIYKGATRSGLAVETNPETAILSPQEFQALLNRVEPSMPIAEDGKIGKQTIEKWERIWMNQQANKTFKELE